MKKYIEPKIKAIALDPEQAIIQACQIGGEYFVGGTFCAGGPLTTSSIGTGCRSLVRGSLVDGTGVGRTASMPS